MASSTTRAPQFKLAVSTSSKLAAEKFSSPSNRNCALEPDYVPNKQRRRERMQSELVDDLDFSAHSGNIESIFQITKRKPLFGRDRPISWTTFSASAAWPA
jgi:hypothetical protein